MKKIDLKKELKYLYAPSAKKVEVVDVPEFNFAMVDGQIEPGKTPATSLQFQDTIGALYGISYTLKFMSKQREVNPIDYTVMALEGLWWTDSGKFNLKNMEDWKYTLMIMQPDHITVEMYKEALIQLKKKKDNPALNKLKYKNLKEGYCMQIMHIGPYSEEEKTIDKMISYANENNYNLRGKHHEIYIGDPRRSKPEKLKTILRYPVKK